MGGEEGYTLGYCDRCGTDRIFKPVVKNDDTEEVISHKCTVCGVHYLDEVPSPRARFSESSKKKSLKRK